jgi:hypothetical protein
MAQRVQVSCINKSDRTDPHQRIQSIGGKNCRRIRQYWRTVTRTSRSTRQTWIYPAPGSVIQIALGNGRFAYGRLYRDASVGVYRQTSSESGKPPIGSRDFRFIVGISDGALNDPAVMMVGSDPFVTEDDWPPPYSVEDPITKRLRIYHRGEIRPPSDREIDHIRELEPAAVWELSHIVRRIQELGT